jgi:hypothetical protein
MTILADKKAALAARSPAQSETILARKRAQMVRGELVDMPIVGQVWVELVGEAVACQIEAAVYAAMEADGLAMSALNMRSYDHCRAALTLAWAARNPTDHNERVGTDADWRAMDPDVIVACDYVYLDVRQRLSPVALGSLTKDQLDAIRLGIEKKNPMPLLSAGVVALSLYLLSTGEQPATSPSTKSSTGESQ